MNNAELAEIRARLRASAETESRPHRPLLAPLRALLRPPAAAAPPSPALPPPRRVGLRPTSAVEDEAELVLSRPIDPAPAVAAPSGTRRNAFGQRPEPEFLPLRLLDLEPPGLPMPIPAPTVDRSALEQAVRRLGSAIVRPDPASAPSETPYHPEDVADPPDRGARRLHAEAGPDEPPPPVRHRLRRSPPVETPPAASPEQELLRHLERVFTAELAGIDARRIA
ncbi:MAG TPA: hypothetical protein VL460_02615 [Caulobacteraceae bacterium]|jgi:hypothetical protein|nr:hypothetical protein [Caulobacteraceae bacterium]